MERASTGRASGVAWLCFLAATSLLFASPADAQRLLQLDPRVSAASEAVITGSAAVFWNPASIMVLERRAEATVIEVRAPESTGLGGMAASVSVRLDSLTAVALGFVHVGIDGIERTSESPLPGQAEGTFDLAEDVLSAAVTRQVREGLVFGLGLHYIRAADVDRIDDAFELGAGVDYRSSLPLTPTFAFAMRLEEDRAAWLAGIELTPIREPDGEWLVTASYGAAGGGHRRDVGHRVAAGAHWNERIAVSAGFAGDPDGDGVSWAPVASAELRLSRYGLGVLRESLPNDFGAVYALRFTVQF